MGASRKEAKWLEALVPLIRERMARLPGAVLLGDIVDPAPQKTDPSNEGWYIEIGGIKGTGAGFYAFIDNSHPTAPRALWYGVSDTTKPGIDSVEEAGYRRWPYTQRYRGHTPPKTFRFDDPWYQRYARDEYYYGWMEREVATTNNIPPPSFIVDRIAERFSSLLVEISTASDTVAPLEGIDVTDALRTTTIRLEQSRVRKKLFGKRTTSACDLCRRELPIDLLVAAHVKARARCSEAERRDVQGNILALCVLGCDGLFERGYVAVENGIIVAGPRRPTTSTVETLLSELKALPSPSWNAARFPYFAAHHSHHSELVRRVSRHRDHDV